MNYLKSVIIMTFCLSLLLSYPVKGVSQDFPNKTITIYSGWEAGATVDLVTRGLADGAKKKWGVPVIVEDHPGANGGVALALLKNREPNGYTLSSALTINMLAMPIQSDIGYDPIKDYLYIHSMYRVNHGICVRKESPIKTIQDLIEYARKNPGVPYAHAGVGGSGFLTVEYLARQANVKFKPMAYKGGAPSCTALLGGHVEFLAGSGTHRVYVQQDKFRMLAATNTEERDPDFPDVPTLKELGYKDGPANYYLLIAPKGTPEAIFKKLENTFLAVAHSSEMQELLRKLGVSSVIKNRQQLEAQLPQDYAFMNSFLRELDLAKKK